MHTHSWHRGAPPNVHRAMCPRSLSEPVLAPSRGSRCPLLRLWPSFLGRCEGRDGASPSEQSWSPSKFRLLIDGLRSPQEMVRVRQGRRGEGASGRVGLGPRAEVDTVLQGWPCWVWLHTQSLWSHLWASAQFPLARLFPPKFLWPVAPTHSSEPTWWHLFPTRRTVISALVYQQQILHGAARAFGSFRSAGEVQPVAHGDSLWLKGPFPGTRVLPHQSSFLPVWGCLIPPLSILVQRPRQFLKTVSFTEVLFPYHTILPFKVYN